MKKVITYETLRYFGYSNDRICVPPIRGIVLDFFGLGGQDMFMEDIPRGVELAQKGMILLVPYNNPWAWMNPQAVQYTDELVDVLLDRYHLPEDLPVVSSGGSMGGLSSLVYARYAKRTPVACVANCPVCDLPYHYTERPDLPRTLYSAFFNSGADNLEEAMKAASPLHLAPDMPDIPYTIFHCEEDAAVNIHKHSQRFVKAMKGRRVEYYTVPGRNHCDLTEEMRALYDCRIEQAILQP